MENMVRSEMEAAAREILEYLEAHGDAPVVTLKDTLGKPDLYFYMGLGDLILRQQVTIQDRQGTFWTIRRPGLAKAA